MSVTAKKYTWGVKVYLQQALTEDTDIGLYVENFGAANTQIDITNPSGTTFRYTWDGTGTDPNFLTNGMNIGDMVVINSTNFNAANNGTFRVTVSADGYFEITNAAGVAENNKTLGSTTAIKSAHQFRWIQNTVTTAKTWKQGILVDKAIAPIEQEADFMTTGNVAQVRGTTVSFKNIDGTTPLWKTMSDAGINIIGKKIQIIEFDHSANPATETVLGTYIFDGAPKWSESAISVNAVSAYYKRDILMGGMVDAINYPYASGDDIGKKIPITFGDFTEMDIGGGFAKLIRVNYTGDMWQSYDSVLTGISEDADGQTSYVVVSVVDDTNFKIKISNGPFELPADLTAIKAELTNQYVHVLSDANNSGVYRRITDVDIDATMAANGQIQITVYSSFKQALGVPVALVAGAIVSIENIAREFIADNFETIGAVDFDGSTLTTRPIVLIDNDGFTRIPESAFTVKAATDNNILQVDVETAVDNPDRFVAVVSKPFTSFEKETTSSLALTSGTYSKAMDGVYVLNVLGRFTIIDMTETGIGEESDGDGTSYYNMIYNQSHLVSSYGNTAMVFRMVMPDAPEYFNFSAVYLGIKMSIDSIRTGSAALAEALYMDIALKHWSNYYSNTTYKSFRAGESSATMENLPTWHYSANPAANNTKYFKTTDPAGAGSAGSGFELFKLQTGSIDIDYTGYDAIKELIFSTGLTITTGASGATYEINGKIYEIALLFYYDASINDAIYTPFKGRIYDDTWGARKTAADLIESPVDMLEHALRLQNWNDRDSNISFGRAYSPNALINTASTETGFDYAGLDDLRTIKAARQILDEGDATTGAVVDSLCKQFDLCSFQSNAGVECVNSILPSAVARDVVLSLNDIIPDSISDFEEIPPQYIYCEPYVQYAYNSASSKYDGIIRVTNASADTFSAAYVSGYSGSEAETIWKMAHALYLRYGIVTEPPSERTELKWIRRSEDAKKILINWLQHMGATTTDGTTYRAANRRRFSFSVPYERAMTIGATHTPWYVSMKFDITLPHQTANVQLQCMVEKIRFDIYGGTADITAICYDIASEIQYYVKDTYGSSSPGLDDWKDTYQTQAEAPTNGNDIKNNY
jgi:hypothetical protein